MALFDNYDRRLPDHYDTMYRDGYTPQQISYALHRKMIQDYEAKKTEAEQNQVWNVRITSEVKVK